MKKQNKTALCPKAVHRWVPPPSATHFRKPKRNFLNVWHEKKIEMKSSSKQNAGTIITNKAKDNGTIGRKVKGEEKQSRGKALQVGHEFNSVMVFMPTKGCPREAHSSIITH